MVDDRRQELLNMDYGELQKKAQELNVSTGRSVWRSTGTQGGGYMDTVGKTQKELAADVQRAELEKEAEGLGVSTTTTSQVAAAGRPGWFGSGPETRTSVKEKTLGRLQEDILRKGGDTRAQEQAQSNKTAEEAAEKAAKAESKEKNRQKAAEGTRGPAAAPPVPQEAAGRAATSQLQDIENSSSASLGTLIDLVKGIFDCVCGAKAIEDTKVKPTPVSYTHLTLPTNREV